ALAVLVVCGRLHPARNTNCCDLPDPVRWSVSAVNFSCSALPVWCYPSSLPVSFISCASEHVDNLGAYSIPSGDRPSHLICYQQRSRSRNPRGMGNRKL